MVTQDNWTPSIDEPRGGESPLQEFTGVLKDWVRDVREFTNDKGQTNSVMDLEFHFTDVEVIESLEPYPHIVADIRVRYSDPARSRGNDRWTHFAESLRNIYGKDAQAMNKMVSKRQHWKRVPSKIRARVPDDGDTEGFSDVQNGWGNTLAPCWKVLEVEGMASSNGTGPSTRERALDLAVGKDATAFYDAAMSDEAIRRDPSLMDLLLNRTFLEQALANNLLTQGADGILAKAS